ncbi:MAG TPA: hypothetical protein IAB96_08945 [Candidatus Coprenecus pullicola]|nr:hypothetical protein [Candidatus Coprenecus pullicola]
MEYNQNIGKQLDSYSELFDIYLERGRIPQEYEEEPLSRYMRSQIEGLRDKIEKDEDLRELLRENIITLFGRILPGVLEIQAGYKRELKMMQQFFGESLEGQRQQWPQVKRWLSYNFPKDMLNAEGYANALRKEEKSKEQIFEALRYNWERCALLMKERRLESHIRNCLRGQALGIGKQDYRTRRKMRSIIFKYPALEDILRQIGREHEKDTIEKDITAMLNVPILLRHSSSRQEIDGVTTGNNLACLLPTEYALMDESVFYRKYVDRQLQQFHSKPPTVSKQKSDRTTKPESRLEMGPIILAIDTSGSMSGKPIEICKALLTRIIYLARKQKRKCFLITFSVRARYLEITRPGQYSKVEDFFSDRFTGGTDGEEMLSATLKALGKGAFSMADVLIISDFLFPLPKPDTSVKIRNEQAKGTRFYGLCIGRHIGPYSKVLDKFWTI